MAVVDMVLNFLITDKSIMAERSSVPSQVSKCSSTSVFFMKYLATKEEGEVWMIRGKIRSLQEQHSIQFAKMQLIGLMLFMRKISPPKA